MGTTAEAALQKNIDALMSLAGFGPEIKKLIGEEGWLQLADAVQASRAALETMKEDRAPDLLEALTEARMAIDYAKLGTTDPVDERLFQGTLGRIDAAISKATGGQ